MNMGNKGFESKKGIESGSIEEYRSLLLGVTDEKKFEEILKDVFTMENCMNVIFGKNTFDAKSPEYISAAKRLEELRDKYHLAQIDYFSHANERAGLNNAYEEQD